ncbi:MAG: zinc ABC transporter substrate-binding protein, partial [Nitrososphaeraceae archaeon]|nr:zinc ABC transporter substrate-binding protein [Nitrososphaeraceae archaeon]
VNHQVKLGIISIAIVIPLAISAVWYSNQPEPVVQYVEATKVVALASFYPLYEFTKEVGGEKVDVSLLVPLGMEPHDWEPTINDIQRIRQADLIIINGVGFESWIENIEEINPDVTIIDSSKRIKIIKWQTSDHDEEDGEHNHDESLGDPHIWLNPLLAKIQVQNIADGLIQFNPENEKTYVNNANAFIKKLDDLDSKIRDGLTNCKRDFIVYHNAFSYFADEYELTQHTIVKTNDPHAEPTSRHFEDIINLAQELDLKIIFTEEAEDSRISQVIADEFNAKVLTLSPLEITNDGSSYIENMEKNLINLQKALCN